MERTRTLIGTQHREHLARSLERLSAGLALQRIAGKARIVRADPPPPPANEDPSQDASG